MNVAVYGASGHTGTFVVAELARRGHTPVAIGRDVARVAEALPEHLRAGDVRSANIDDSHSLDDALSGVDAVINCAGPFLETARPVIEAALRARIDYYDVTAEQASAADTLETYDREAKQRGIAILPAAGFFGGLGDVLATAAMGDAAAADRIEIAIALDSWQPTLGTRRTGERNTEPRVVLAGGKLIRKQDSGPRSWPFAHPFGTLNVLEVPLTETILIAHHLNVRECRNFLSEAPLNDLADPATPEPSKDERGRSRQQFHMDALVEAEGWERRVAIGGRDIYAVTAPIVVEALERVSGAAHRKAGTFALGHVVDASDFLASLEKTDDPIVRHLVGERVY